MSELSRRQFLVAIPTAACAAAAASPSVVLNALYGANLPHRIVVPAIPVTSPYFELRRYRTQDPEGFHGSVTGVFAECGIYPVVLKAGGDELTYLIPFDSMGQRATAWDRVTSHPEWSGKRADLAEVTVYSA